MVSEEQRAKSLKSLAIIMAWMTTISYLTPNQNNRRHVEMHIESEIEDFEFQDPIMQNRFSLNAKKAISEDGLFVTIQSTDENNFGTINAMNLDDFVLVVNTLALLAGNEKNLQLYTRIIAPTVTILVSATKSEMSSPIAKRALQSAHTTALEIDAKIKDLKQKQ